MSRTLLSWLCILGCFGAPFRGHARLVIDEILTRNTAGLEDEDGQTSEWIEIRNSSLLPINLAGWGLTDQPGQPAAWVFPATNLLAGARLIIFATGKARAVAGKPLHASFRLPSEEGYLGLLSPQGSVESELHYGPQQKDISYGLGKGPDLPPWVQPTSEARFLIPGDALAGGDWRSPDEEPGGDLWVRAKAAVGFDLSAANETGLLAWWNFNSSSDRTIPEATGSGHPGTLTGAAALTADRGGRTALAGDRALNLGATGNGARMEVPDVRDGWMDSTRTQNAVTFSLWIFGDSTQPGQGSVFWGSGGLNGSGARAAQAHLPWSDGVAYWDTGGTDSSLHRVFTAMPDSTKWKGRWNHYALIKRGNEKLIYQNGRRILAGTSTEPMGLIRSFSVGSGPTGSMSYGGLIDDFAIWNRALSLDEVQALAQGAAPPAAGLASAYAESDIGSKMRGINSSVYLRIPFQVADPALARNLVLKIRYSDGFVAFLNGQEIASRFAPSLLEFDSQATTDSPNGARLSYEEIDVSSAMPVLRAGTNVLAIHGLNSAATDPEFVIQPWLVAGLAGASGYFSEPTPGFQNGETAEGWVRPVIFSRPRGFVAEPFHLQLECPTPGTQLYFTLDGSDPAPGRGIRGTGSRATVLITNTVTVRAAAFRTNFLPHVSIAHSYLFLQQVASQRRPSVAAANWPDGSPSDFLIDGRVVTNALPQRTFIGALEAIPSLIIGTTADSLFGPRGIYANSSSAKDPATDFEIPVSAEYLYPDGREGFQLNAGLEIHGNISRDNNFTPKHGFNLIFKRHYSEGKLKHPMFEGSSIETFDRLVLRGGSTDTWPTVNWDHFLVDGVQRWLRDEASYVRDQWVRDAQLDMGQPSSDGTYAHLYLSGLYWGIYNIAQRPDNTFAASVFGGSRDDYDVLADFAEVRSGDATAWNQMNSLASAGLASDAAYQRIQGNHPDGTRNPAYPVFLDVTNLVDYMILHVYIGADDWPNHNWWAARKRGSDSTGFKWFAWDQEISINSLVKQQSSWGSVYAEADVANTPTHVYARCRANAEFRQLFADRVQLHFFNQGALSLSNNLRRWDDRIAELDRAIVAESARWGDHRRPERPYTREVEWLSSNAWMRAVFFPSNHSVVMKRFLSARLYSSLGAPLFSQFGGETPEGFQLSIAHTNTSGVILATTDGSDPRLRGGLVSPSAFQVSGPVRINRRTTVTARVRSGTNWSASVVATFVPSQNIDALRVTELMFHPAAASGVDADAYEFIELKNTGSHALDLSGYSFSQGIGYEFAPGFTVPPNGFAVLVRDRVAFGGRYPGVSIAGQYSGRLADGGETLKLSSSRGDVVLSLSYSSQPPWPVTADGLGFSFVPRGQVTNLSQDDPRSWRASSNALGSPGRDDPVSVIPEILVSELLSNPTPQEPGDYVELRNPQEVAVDISGWWITDDRRFPKKYRIPAATMIPARGFVTFTPPRDPGASGLPFDFAADGEEVFVFSSDTAGNLTGYSHGFMFGPSQEGVSYVRWLDSQGAEHFLASTRQTPDSPNSPPAIPLLVFSEIHYHPADGKPEYLELHNPGSQTFLADDPAGGTNRWILEGIDFELPSGFELSPGGYAVLASVAPAAFRQAYGLAPSTQVLGPFPGTLQDSGERLQILRPSRATSTTQINALVEGVRYNDRAPWPPAADGSGPSLQRRSFLIPGVDFANWVAAQPTPGTGLGSGLPPHITRQPESKSPAEGTSLSLEVGYEGDEPMTFQWRKNGEAIVGATANKFLISRVHVDDTGDYDVSLSNAAGSQRSGLAQVSVRPLPFIYQHPISRAAASNSLVVLSGAAAGTGRIRFQWLRDGMPILDATNSSLRLTALTPALEGLYSLRVADDVGVSVSQTARVEILRRPEFTFWPRDIEAVEGDTLRLEALASGSLPITYRWRRGLTVLFTQVVSERKASTFLLERVSTAQSGNYSVVIANALATGVTSSNFVLTILSDSDGDRMPTQWEVQHGLDPANPNDGGLDTDRDGMQNRDEFRAGTNPRDPLSFLGFTRVEATPAGARLGFLSVSNRAYVLLGNSSLGLSNWVRIAELPAERTTRERVLMDDSGVTERRYYRLELQQALVSPVP
ncbi:MAG: hypothetical protein FJ405_00415 [Verrucomicrobia bacterium]|nr:hypothetical protein [Verrucomicrobiota bacterium]